MKKKRRQQQYQIDRMEDWDRIAPLLYSEGKGYPVWCFKGELGAGKTTLIKALCRYLGVKEPVTSPTFSLIHEYDTSHPFKIYHMDFYRLCSAEEILATGFESYLNGQDYLFIEWPDRIKALLPPHHLTLYITLHAPAQRCVEVCYPADGVA